LASAREPFSGVDRYFHYDFTFEQPCIKLCVEGDECLTVVDHKPDPLQGGYFGIRNMTPGAIYRFRDLTVAPVPD